MSQQIFDPDRFRNARRKARPEKVRFLFDAACDSLVERFHLIRAEFPHIGILGPVWPDLIEHLRERPGTRSVTTFDVCPGRFTSADVLTRADLLPLKFDSMDAVISFWNLHQVEDLPGALIQIRRALKPDGLFMAAFPGGQSLQDLRQAMIAADIKGSGGAYARLHPMVDLADLAGLLQRAGFALPVADSEALTVEYGAVQALLRDLIHAGESYALATPRPPLTPAYLRTLDQHFSGRVVFEILHGIGWAPAQSQPRPLPRGSAQNRLADALGTEEIATGDKPA